MCKGIGEQKERNREDKKEIGMKTYFPGPPWLMTLITAIAVKSDPVLIPLLLGIRIAGSRAVGTSAFVKGNQNYKELSQQIDTDLSTIESTISKLERSLSSLAKVVLQNRRGLDLFF